MTGIVHDFLPCGIEYGVTPFPRRHIISFQLRVLSGIAEEPAENLGLARLILDTIDKGTERRTGRELSDAFDLIGAAHRSGVGRETTTFTCTVLPEHFEQALALHAEFLRTPTFPQDAFEVNVDLSKQELLALEDDAHALIEKLINREAFGPVLGRHPLGEKETLERITRDDLVEHWRSRFAAGRMIASVAGPIAPKRAAELFERYFGAFGATERAGRETVPIQFAPCTKHFNKPLEQQQIGICWPGVDVTHAAYPVQQVLLGILSGGMSARLFTEVREKQGLVYWVNAWHDTPRGGGMIFMGASTTPERCEQTHKTLLREVERLADDIQPDELERAITGIVANLETRGDSTRARCAELANDLFYFGRPLPEDEKIARVQAVTIAEIREYLASYPRDRLCVVTLGPRALDGAATVEQTSSATVPN
ncbi:MAG: pitrilysin family protein [Phycisphaerae bacterium]|jgi:predicted Zn-dependent peptidase